MVDSTIRLAEGIHPNKEAKKDFMSLVGIDHQKKELLTTLELLLDQSKLTDWEKKYHHKGLPIMSLLKTSNPLIILSGEVGCGKTALAQCVATPLAELLGTQVKVFETPSNIRGGGLVGEISNRITEVFESVKAKLKDNESGLLIIDEADDIATSRAQNQAHHEDRAGLNVLIKQIDAIQKSKKKLAVIMITNRMTVLDPAVRRRTSLHLVFDRPNEDTLEEVFNWIFTGIDLNITQLDDLIKYCSGLSIPYSFSDLIQRVAKQTLYRSVELKQPFSVHLYTEILKSTEPTPLLGEHKIN
ncbi:ATP-binding protein [Mucilaginibacter sp. PAMB04274]|uniref:ATP-binding protein n=1 Tax=Mucilaginibacter sp. PAMB04274 TaxID=3138568 RepID=UPI0031F6614B